MRIGADMRSGAGIPSGDGAARDTRDKCALLDELLDRTFLSKLLKSFYLSTGLHSCLVDCNGNAVAIPGVSDNYSSFCTLVRSCPEGLNRCTNNLKTAGEQAVKLGEPYIFQCHAGLIEWAAPILLENTFLGSLTCGQVLLWNLDEIAIEELKARVSDLGLPEEQVVRATKELRTVSGPNVQASADLLFMVANHVLQADMAVLAQRKMLNEQQARLAEAIHEQKRMEEELRKLKGVEQKSIYPLEKERELLGSVRLGDRTRAREILNQLLGSILFNSAGQPGVIKARIMELLVVLSRAAVEGGASSDKLLGLSMNYLHQLAGIKALEDMASWIVGVLDHFLDVIYETRNSRNVPVLREAVEYIHNNYRRDITLEEVAQRVHISPFYLSHLFKEELGVTFVSFLTRVRIEEAKKLLLETNLTVQQISYEVGYQDSSYFAKVFKKMEGRTPTQYRR